jgi:hypothetical protein
MNQVFEEVKEKADYGAVINQHLMRIVAVRSVIFRTGSRTVVDNVADYLYAVESLYSILLPELRGDSREYLDLGFQMLRVVSDWFNAKTSCEQREMIPRINPCSDAEWDEVKRLEDRIAEFVEGLPTDLRERMTRLPYYNYYHRGIVMLADKALEEMLVRLNEAGLLMRGTPVRVGKF